MTYNYSTYVYAPYTNTPQVYGLGREFDVQKERQLINNALYGELDYYSSLVMSGVNYDAVLQKHENYIESGGKSETNGNGVNGDLLNWNRSIMGNEDYDSRLFQSQNGNLFTDIDFDKGTYKLMDRDGLAESCGVMGGAYDSMFIDMKGIHFLDFLFSGLADGKQDSVKFDLTQENKLKYNADYEFRELNTNYWFTTPDSSNAENAKAWNSLDIIMSTQSQWLSVDDYHKLEAAIGTPDFNKLYADIVKKSLDQENKLPA